MELQPASQYLAQFNIDINDNQSESPVKGHVKFPYVSVDEKRHVKNLDDKIKAIRPNYPSYQNTAMYKDEHCTMWAHVCEASLEEGIVPKMYIKPPALLCSSKH